ncbi:hypothetical protein GA0070608_3438 [Micromonospora peucetia]|uniref:Uncharacterized protein n=1 Tax=Micromonospora peucetia TaxID=47871 RepID=A0A1C6VLB6_9ACTN|nr:hypothetical protein GA0070608_3438 [Micromonospora peucetia]
MILDVFHGVITDIVTYLDADRLVPLSGGVRSQRERGAGTARCHAVSPVS